jgi:antibiotic biosynthesis monooxygenase (ABM) superfamily enzyme
MLKMRNLFTIVLFVFISFFSYAGGVKGIIKNTKGEQLSFASIIVKGTSRGTMANEDGRYELSLEKGSHTLIFQYLGHKPLEKSVEIGADFITFDAVLSEQSVTLNEVRFSAKAEDPAYTIMRKTISMAKFKTLELDAYTSRTYVKGTAQVKEVSGFMKMLAGKKIEKELGLKIGQVYVIESINDINFKQPSSVKEKVVSARNNLPKQLQDQGANFINVASTNFYRPKSFGDMISPLSPSALAYYRFKYEGDFQENGQLINKIKVTPKSKGENVFEGYINIIEDSWYIHSLDLRFSDDNTSNHIKIIYSPFKEVWLPVSYTFRSDFDAFGFKGFFNYVTNVRNYNVTINEKYHQKPVVIDEKIDKAEATALKSEKVDAKTALKQKQITRKQLEKFLKESQKEDKKERKSKGEDVAIVRSYNLEVDSLFKKRGNDFWNEERQVPLTDFEIKGYAQADSIAKANEANYKKDSIKNLPIFKPLHILMGKTYNYGKRDDLYSFYPRSLTYTSPLFGLDLNTVDGYYAQGSLKYETREKLVKRTSLYTDFRYAFGRKAFNFDVGYYHLRNQHTYEIKAGSMIQQYNANNPIQNIANTIYTMLLDENYLKIYEKDFINFEYRNRFTQTFSLGANFEYAKRRELQNVEGFKPWIDSKEKEFTSNRPESIELKDSKFVNPEVLMADINLIFRPFAKKRTFNDREITVNQGNPIFRIRSTNGVLSEGNFSILQGSYEQTFEMEKIGDLHFLANYGGYLKEPTYFSDFRHFNGNRTFVRSFRFDAFRNLDYYQHSTTGNYLEVFVANDFQKFLLTQITPLRIYGLKESIFANYLNVAKQDFNYLEVGYGISGIGKLFGLEVVGNFVNGTYGSTVLRVKFNR